MIRLLRSLISGFWSHRQAEISPRPLPEILFYPVIFANGRDDDTEGVKAFYENKPVMMDGRLIPAGKPCVLRGHEFRFFVSGFWFTSNGRMLDYKGFVEPGRPIARCEVSHGVQRMITHSSFDFGAEVRP